MKIEIWSDIMCPFCYIGKRKFEAALAEFPGKDHVEIIWKSFQLDPDMTYEPNKDIYSYLAERKGQSREWSVQMHQQVTDMAKQAGLDYHFEKAVINNSFDAHRLIQYAKTQGLGDAMEERLFHAYFTEGKNIGDHNTLAELGADIGLDNAAVKAMLASGEYTQAVEHDVMEAQQLGARGVPFFVFDRKYGVSGAQPSDTFLEVLNTSYAEWQKQHPVSPLNMTDGAVCTPGGDCD